MVVGLHWEKGLCVAIISLSIVHQPFKVVVDTGATDTSVVFDSYTYPHLRSSEMVKGIVGFLHTSGQEPNFQVEHDFQSVKTLVVDNLKKGTGIKG